jgi:hypothetical protein
MTDTTWYPERLNRPITTKRGSFDAERTERTKSQIIQLKVLTCGSLKTLV